MQILNIHIPTNKNTIDIYIQTNYNYHINNIQHYQALTHLIYWKSKFTHILISNTDTIITNFQKQQKRFPLNNFHTKTQFTYSNTLNTHLSHPHLNTNLSITPLTNIPHTPTGHSYRAHTHIVNSHTLHRQTKTTKLYNNTDIQ